MFIQPVRPAGTSYPLTRFAGTNTTTRDWAPNPYDPESIEKRTLYHHTSNLFRSCEDLHPLIRKVYAEYQTTGQLPHFICHGVSDGSDAYTLVLLMHKLLGRQLPPSFLPIDARDISAPLIAQNQAGYFKTLDIDKRQFTEFMPGKRYETYFDAEAGRVRPNLHQHVTFRQGDIVEDARKPFPQKTVLLFRNAMYWLPESRGPSLAHNLFRNMPQGSLIMLGGMPHDARFKALLIQEGFKAVEGLKTVVAR